LQNHTKVIPFVVRHWRFYDFADDIEEWYQSLPDEGRDILNGLLKVNSKTEIPRNWIACDMLQGPCKDDRLWEWKFRVDNIQQRLIGVFGPQRGTAIFLIGCSHKQKIYKPANCLETAIRRAGTARNGGSFREREVREDF
jgi:hypothetical protein